MTATRDSVRVLHVHGQEYWHDDVIIIGNGQALAALRELISLALARNSASSEFTVADGEGFNLSVQLRAASFGDPQWNDCAVPYTSEIARSDNGKKL